MNRLPIAFARWVTLVVIVLFPAFASADVRPTVAKIRWVGDLPDAAQPGKTTRGHLEIVTRKAGVLENLVIEGAGWTVRPLTSTTMTLAPDQARPIAFDAVPTDPTAPLVVRATFEGQTIEKTLHLDAASIEAARRPHPVAAERAPILGGVKTARLQGQTIRFKGRFTYVRGDTPPTVELGADNILIRIRDDDSPDPFDDTIWEGGTDENGNFDVTVNWDDCDITGCDDPDVYLEIVTHCPQIDVQADDTFETTYAWETGVINDFTGNFIDFGTLHPDDGGRGAVHVYTAMVRAYRYGAENGGMSPGELLDVQWPSGGNAYYDPDYKEIHISAARTWQEWVCGHEYAHFLEDSYGYLDWPNYSNGFCDSQGPGHCLWCPENLSDGWQEGWADWFGWSLANAWQGRYGYAPWVMPSFETVAMCSDPPNPVQYYPGGMTEGYVAALLVDMEDGTNETNGANPCLSDATTIDVARILNVIRDDDPVDVYDFIDKFRLHYNEYDQDLWSTATAIDTSFGFPVPPPVILSQPVKCIVARDADPSRMEVTGNGKLLKYQWRKNGVDLMDGVVISGSETRILAISQVSVDMDGVYTCRVSTCDGTYSVISLPCHLSVKELARPAPLISWGSNQQGECGTRTPSLHETPSFHAQVTRVVGADGNSGFTIALRADGSVWSWGFVNYGELGNGMFYGPSYTPAPIPDLGQVLEISSGYYHTLALKRDGSVVGWGYNGYGQLGDGTTVDRYSPVLSNALGNQCVRAIRCGGYHALALLEDGTVLAWGYNASGQLGRGTIGGYSMVPQPVQGLDHVIAIAAASDHSFALRDDGTVWGWGANSQYALGDGTTTNRPLPVQVTGLSNIRSISAGTYRGHAISNTGVAYGWGTNQYGVIGNNGSETLYPTPVVVPDLADAQKIDESDSYWSMALMANGTVKVWGYNYEHINGSDTPNYIYIPQTVPGLETIRDIAADWGTAHAFGSLAGVTAIGDADVPGRLSLKVSPNPSFAATRLAFDLPAPGRVSVSVYDVAGRRVRSLIDEVREPGRYSTSWDGRGPGYGPSLVGVYFVRLELNGAALTQRVVRMK